MSDDWERRKGYYKQGWKKRWEAMGDQAEAAFEKAYAINGFQRFGLNRAPFSVATVPAKIRFTPDYLMADRFIECKGIGQDQTLKIKVNQLLWLMVWNSEYPVAMFIFDSWNQRHALMPIDELWIDCHACGHVDSFPEGHQAWFIDVAQLDLAWQSI